ncbi:MAG: hypothetical protein R2705_21300 [Ilumatobacteraceae bacterium]
MQELDRLMAEVHPDFHVALIEADRVECFVAPDDLPPGTGVSLRAVVSASSSTEPNVATDVHGHRAVAPLWPVPPLADVQAHPHLLPVIVVATNGQQDRTRRRRSAPWAHAGPQAWITGMYPKLPADAVVVALRTSADLEALGAAVRTPDQGLTVAK